MRKLSAGLAGVAGIALIAFLPGAASAQGVGLGGGYGVDGGGFGTLNVMAGPPGGIPTPPGGPGSIPTPPVTPAPPMTPEPPMGAPILPGPPANPGAPGFIPTPGDLGGAPPMFPGRVTDRFSQASGRTTLPGEAIGAPLPPSFGIWSAGGGAGAAAAPTPVTGAPTMPAALTARFGLLPSNAATRIPTSIGRR